MKIRLIILVHALPAKLATILVFTVASFMHCLFVSKCFIRPMQTLTTCVSTQGHACKYAFVWLSAISKLFCITLSKGTGPTPVFLFITLAIFTNYQDVRDSFAKSCLVKLFLPLSNLCASILERIAPYDGSCSLHPGNHETVGTKVIVWKRVKIMLNFHLIYKNI